MIIGLTGTKASGKGVVADILKDLDFVYTSLSDRVREEATTKGMQTYTVKDLQDIGNEIRKKFGLGELAKRSLEKTKDKKKVVFDGVRNLGEIEEIKKRGGIIIAIDAPTEERFKRLIERRRASDPKNWEEFLIMDARDKGINENNTGQQVSRCIQAADYQINNNSTIEELKRSIYGVLDEIREKMPPEKEKISKRKGYIGWDEYFMGIAMVSAQRSKDSNTQVGACIVNQEKKIVGIGYNGFPIGCDDNNLPWAREGEFLETKYPYVCHAELNAILNSAGRDLKGCSIYIGMLPCNECAKAIIQSGIKEIVYLSDKYIETDSIKATLRMFNQAGIKQRKLFLDKDSLTINFPKE